MKIAMGTPRYWIREVCSGHWQEGGGIHDHQVAVLGLPVIHQGYKYTTVLMLSLETLTIVVSFFSIKLTSGSATKLISDG